uniref:Uncharacterized protein n=1 Tax=Rhizophora mucronata TaxID=61149 RepID=A0A2P2P3L4_RHIMU
MKHFQQGFSTEGKEIITNIFSPAINFRPKKIL